MPPHIATIRVGRNAASLTGNVATAGQHTRATPGRIAGLLSRVLRPPSIIGTARLNFSVRKGKRWNHFRRNLCSNVMKLNVVVHDAEEGGFWAEVPSIPGCATQGESFEELLENLYEAVEGCLSIDIAQPMTNHSHIVQIAV